MTKRKERKINPAIVRERCLYTRVHFLKVTPCVAAEMLGYKTPQISKMEKKTSKTSINHNYVHKLSEVAGVSLDYLYGYSDYPERDPQTVEQIAVYQTAKTFTENALFQFTQILMSSVEVNSLGWRFSHISDAWKEFEASFQKVKELNPEFDDEIRGGARLQKSVEITRKAIKDAMRHIEMLKKDNTRVKRLGSALADSGIDKQIDFVGFGEL